MTREEFYRLIDKYLSGNASPAEESLMDDFFDANERQCVQEQYKFGERLWTSIKRRLDIKNSPPPTFRGTNKTSFGIRGILVPLTILIAIVAVFTLLNNNGTLFSSDEDEWITFSSSRGEKSMITLTDGSRVYLNSGSSILYPETFLSEKREVVLSGEAFFEITRDANRPFLIRSGHVTTAVLGTSFNIQAYPDKIVRVTVATGKVRVDVKPEENKQFHNRKSKSVTLNAHEQAIFTDGNSELITSKVDINQFIAWKENTLQFKDASLEEVADQLENWYNVTIEFKGEALKNCRINGRYKDQSLSKVLKSIQYMYQIEFKFEKQNKVLLYGRGCNN